MVISFGDLEAFGKLVRARFYHNEDAQVELKFPPGPAFTVGGYDLGAGELVVLEDNEIFLRLIRARLRAEGKRLEDLSRAEIERRFFFDERTYRRTIQGRKPPVVPI